MSERSPSLYCTLTLIAVQVHETNQKQNLFHLIVVSLSSFCVILSHECDTAQMSFCPFLALRSLLLIFYLFIFVFFAFIESGAPFVQFFCMRPKRSKSRSKQRATEKSSFDVKIVKFHFCVGNSTRP